jgi:tripartite-type tricarboxylate transporter receptor subunit TctC
MIALNRRRTLLSLALLAMGIDAHKPASAETDANYPSRVIRLIVGFAAGGGNDIIARIVADKLQTSLGQPVVIEDKPGAGGRLSAVYVAAQPADGYTLLLGASGTMAVSPAVYKKLSYSPLRDFVPISMIASFPLILVVHPSGPKNIQELVDWAKAHPDQANYGTSSPAFTLATELFKLKTGAPMTPIPYKSSTEACLSVISQQSLLAIVDPPPSTSLIKSGQLRALAVTSATRLADLPDVPTMAEAGVPGVEVSLWTGVFAPAGTAPAIIKKLEAEVQGIMRLPDVQEKFRQMATPIVGSTSDEFAGAIASQIKFWTEIEKQANVEFDE